MSTLFNFEIKGTRLRPLFLFKSSIIQDKISTWHLSNQEIRCSEVSSNSRILFDYVLYTRNLVDYEYKYPDEITKIKFELKWIIEKMQEVKIKNRVKFTIMDEDPETMVIKIFGLAKSRKDKAIKLSINPDTVLQVSPDIYYENPVTLHKDDFLPFLKMKPQSKGGKIMKEEIEIKIQAPNYIKFSRLKDSNESEKYGIYKKDAECYKENFFINEIKNVFKLAPSTTIFNIYQPKVEKAPLRIGGLAGEFGYWNVYIHCSQCDPLKEIEE